MTSNERRELQEKAKRDFINRASLAITGSADDLREKGFSVAVHNDYQHNGERHTFWLLTIKVGDQVYAYKGEGKSDAEALDLIRRAHAKATDKLHHAPACPANHYCGQRAPTSSCNCGAADFDVQVAAEVRP